MLVFPTTSKPKDIKFTDTCDKEKQQILTNEKLVLGNVCSSLFLFWWSRNIPSIWVPKPKAEHPVKQLSLVSFFFKPVNMSLCSQYLPWRQTCAPKVENSNFPDFYSLVQEVLQQTLPPPCGPLSSESYRVKGLLSPSWLVLTFETARWQFGHPTSIWWSFPAEI